MDELAVAHTAAAPGPTRLARLGQWVERRATVLLAAMVALHALIFALASIYKFDSFLMGFDLGTHEQVLWNTAHLRIAEVSAFGTTSSYLGVDIILLELLLAPLYALVPRTETMLVLQALLAATGGIPIFLIARDRSGQRGYGLLGALLYLGSLPVQYAILYEFQIRTLGTVLLLWAVLFFERRRLGLFLTAGVLAMWTRSDAGLALAAMGLYALLLRRRWPWAALPLVLGLGWVILCVKVLIPAYRSDHEFIYGFLWDWLGKTPLEMVTTLVTRPGFVAEHVLTGEKLWYLFELLAPLLFLPLLRPGLLMVALPSLALNLLSPDRIHWSIRYHYQAFVIPFLLIGTLYALIDLARRWPALGHGLAALLVLATLGSQLVLRSPLIGLATRARDEQRLVVARDLLARVPEGASVTATSLLGSHLGRRRELYFYPGNVIYRADPDQGRYLLADLRDIPPEYLPQLRALQQGGSWRTIEERAEFVLLERVTE